MTIAEKIRAISEKIALVFEKGKSEGRRSFMENYQLFGERNHYTGAFSGRGWTDDLYAPLYPIVHSSPATASIFTDNIYITDTRVPIDVRLGNLQTTFRSCNSLKTVRLIKCSESTLFNGAFDYCTKLENVSFEGTIGTNISFSACTKLYAQSIDGIFSCLGGSQNALLTLPDTAKSNYDAFYGEGAFEARIAARPSNWTVAY